MNISPVLTVYFDGSCPLCRREIALYRRLPEAVNLAWLDVSQDPALGPALTCQAAMARFHVRHSDGRLVSGAAAFSDLWRCFSGWRWLGVVSAQPPLAWMFEVAYQLFLPVRPLLQRSLRRWDRQSHSL